MSPYRETTMKPEDVIPKPVEKRELSPVRVAAVVATFGWVLLHAGLLIGHWGSITREDVGLVLFGNAIAVIFGSFMYATFPRG